MNLVRSILRVSVVSIALATGLASQPVMAEVETINPRDTDNRITFETNPNKYHWYYTPTVRALNKLAVFFPGSEASAAQYTKLSQYLADNGLHVVVLGYDNDTPAFALCDGLITADALCYRKYRHEVVFGSTVVYPYGGSAPEDSNKVAVDKWNSAENRLLQLMTWLAENRDRDDWGQFISTKNNVVYSSDGPRVKDLNWSMVRLGGHSQGSGVALYLAKRHAVDRVALIGGPQDGWYEDGLPSSPDWLTRRDDFQTDSDRIYGFIHRDENTGGNDQVPMTPLQEANWEALLLPGNRTFLADEADPPYPSNKIETALAPPRVSEGCVVVREHASTSSDTCVPGDPPAHEPKWGFLFGLPNPR